MENQVRFYVSRRNGFTWLSAVTAIAAVVLTILSLAMGRYETLTPINFWFQGILPILVCLSFALVITIAGDKSFYRVSTIIFWGCIFFGELTLDLYLQEPDAGLFVYLRYVIVCWILYLVFYFIFRLTVTGRFKHSILFILISLGPVAAMLYDMLQVWPLPTYLLLEKIAHLLVACAVLFVSFAMRPFCDGVYHKTWGDRSDGRLLRSMNGMAIVEGFFMGNRTGASNSIGETVEITNIERYIHRKRAEGLVNFGFTHVFLAAYVRTVAKYPGCNRFYSGQRIYQHDDDIIFIMDVKKEMSLESPDTMIKLHLSRSDTSREVYEKFNKVYEEVKSTPLNSSFDQVAGLMGSLPRLLMKFVVWVLRVMDYFGRIPRFLLEVSPFHGSIIFTSMASLGIPPVVHHLYDFGNLPAFVSFGRKYRRNEIDAQGNVVTRRYIDYKVNCDDRIMDGFYYASAMKHLQKLLKNPDILDKPVDPINQDIA